MTSVSLEADSCQKALSFLWQIIISSKIIIYASCVFLATND